MQHVKRIEIVVDSPEIPELLQVLRAHGIRGYTLFTHLRGGGDRGERFNDEPGGGNGNSCLLTAAEPAAVPALVEAIQPILRRRGGMCLISDAQWVLH
jgi:hypothetical protein